MSIPSNRPAWRRFLWPIVGGVIGLCVICGVIASLVPDSPAAIAEASRAAVASVDAPPLEASTAPEPMSTVEPSDAPSVPPSAVAPSPVAAEDQYVAIARQAAGPIMRAAGVPDDAWSFLSVGPGDIQVQMPLTEGISNEQTVRVGQQVMSQVINKLFTERPELTQVNIVGSTPLNGTEAPAISIVVPVAMQLGAR